MKSIKELPARAKGRKEGTIETSYRFQLLSLDFFPTTQKTFN